MNKPNWLVVNAGQSATEILITGQIGKSFWDDSGTSASEFQNALNAIPAGSRITVGINSEGGSVKDGIGIYNAIKARREEVVCRVDGYAVSIASIIALAGSKTISPKSSVWMIHEPWSYTQGNAEDHLKSAEMLEQHANMLVDIYVEETGKSADEIRAAMKKETWLRGTEAVAFGLADELTEEQATLNSIDLTRFGNVPQDLFQFRLPVNKQADRGPASLPKTQNMSEPIKTEEGRVQAGPTATDETNRIAAIEARLNAERESRIKATVAQCVNEFRIPANQTEAWVKRAVADEAVLADLRALPQNLPGPEPLRPIEVTNASPSDLDKEFSRLKGPQQSFQRGNMESSAELCASGRAISNLYNANRERLLGAFNDNSVGSDTQRTVILQEVMRAFRTQLLPLRAFSTYFGNQVLQGTDKVTVPYYALVSGASTAWNAGNGYVMGDSAQSNVTVTIDKRYYQPMRFSSSELARQPYNVMQIATLKGEKLAADVFADVLSLVTSTNYGAASITSSAANFDTDDIATLKGICDVAKWPESGRSLILTSTYDVNVNKSTVLTNAAAYGSAEAIRDGRVPRIMGFDYYMNNNVPANSWNLVGFAVFPSAIAVATSPIRPDEDVMASLRRYELVVDPQTGATFEYRAWGSADYDQSRSVIECNYGYVKAEAAAIKSIVSG